VDPTKPYNVGTAHVLGLAVQVSIPLKQRLFSFSHLSLCAGASFLSAGFGGGFSGTTLYSGIASAPGIRYVGRLYVSDIDATGSYLVFAEAKTPIAYLSRDWRMTIGAGALYQRIKFRYEILPDGYYTQLDPQLGFPSGIETFDHNESDVIPYVITGMNIRLFRILDVFVEGRLLHSAKIGVACDFSL
jgi:hypothetical protein